MLAHITLAFSSKHHCALVQSHRTANPILDCCDYIDLFHLLFFVRLPIFIQDGIKILRDNWWANTHHLQMSKCCSWLSVIEKSKEERGLAASLSAAQICPVMAAQWGQAICNYRGVSKQCESYQWCLFESTYYTQNRPLVVIIGFSLWWSLKPRHKVCWQF